MSKKIFLVISLLIAAAMVLAACAPATEAPTEAPPEATEAPVETEEPKEEEPTKEPTEEPVITEEPEMGLSGTLTLWHAWKENEIESGTEVIAAFQEIYPDVEFDVLYVPFDDLRGKFETAAATGGGPTVLIGAADWGPAFYDALLVADVTEYASDEFLATINPAAMSSVEYKDALIGLPQTLKGVVLFRNTSIIPEAPATFDDLVAASQEATAGDVVGADLEYGFFFSAGHLDGVGGQLMDAEGNPTFNDEKGLEWVGLIQQFPDAGPVENYTDNDVNLFKEGKVGLVIDGTWNAASLQEAIGAENLAVDAWPSPMSGYVQTESIYLSANATGDDAEVGWAFMEFFLSPEAQTLLADTTKAGHIPAIAGVEIDDPLLQQEVAAFAGGAPFPVIPEMGAYWDPLNNALLSVMDQGTDPAEALQAAYDAIVAKVAEIRGE